MIDNINDKFEIVRHLALFGKNGGNINDAAKQALEMTCNYIKLNAAAIYMWDNEQNVSVTVSYAEDASMQPSLSELELNLYDNLRKNQKLVSAYMSFGGENPFHSFTLPLMYSKQIFGAVIGIQKGDKSPVAEDIFLETLSAMLALNYAAHENVTSEQVSQEVIDKERLSAVLETAVTVNHEVNNPLQAIIGNIQLLLMKSETLDSNIVDKLKAIEESAIKINSVTQRLMQITTPKTVHYSDGTKMIDINGDDESSD